MKIIIFIAFLISFNQISASSCSYIWEFNQCIEAQKTWTTRAIEDFVCIPSGSSEQVMSQIILDIKFKEIDKDVEEYLTLLEEQKDRYFGINAEKTFIEAIDEIEEVFWINSWFGVRYNMACREVLQESMSCMWWVMKNFEATKFFPVSTCMNLYSTKLEIYKQVSYDILKLNKHQVRLDSTKEYQQQQRWMYNKLLDAFMINLSLLERIWRNWPGKTRDAH